MISTPRTIKNRSNQPPGIRRTGLNRMGKELISRYFFLGFIMMLNTPSFADTGHITLTIYNRDILQYRETKTIAFNSGIQSFEFLQPLSHLFVSSLRVEPIVRDSSIRTISIEFLPEGIDFATIWSLHVGKMISFQQGNEFFHGKLLRVTDTHIYLQPDTTQSRISIIDKNMLSTVSFDSLPVTASGPSRIIWSATSHFEQTAPVRISYLAPGMNWRVAYHLWLTGEQTGILRGVYSIENTTSRDFQQVNVELIAGDPILSGDESPTERGSHPGGDHASSTEWNSYQKYLLPKPIDIASHHACQFEFLSSIPLSGNTHYLIENATLESAPVQHVFEFTLDEHHSLALPWGEVTVYGDTVNGGTFIGEDYIGPASVGSRVTLKTGVAFDVTARKERIKYVRKSKNEAEETSRISVSNATNRSATITIHESVYGSWKLLSSISRTGSILPVKTDAVSLEWRLTISQQSEDYLEYTLEKNR